MEELDVFLNYEENTEELRERLLCTITQLESLKAEASKQIIKHEEEVQNLINLITIVYNERDEAKNQLQILYKKLTLGNPAELHQIHTHPTKINSSATELNWNSQSDNHNNIEITVASPELSRSTNSDAFVQERGSSNNLLPPISFKADPADTVIDGLVKGKVLPQKGMLLQTLMEAAPLLQTLLVSGPLPQWRNPPPLQTFKIPPMTITSCEISPQKPLNLAGLHQTCSSSVMNFSSVSHGSGSGIGSKWMMDYGAINQTTAAKRQRFQ